MVPLNGLFAGLASVGADENRYYATRVTQFVEMFEIEPVAIRLRNSRAVEMRSTEFIFYNEDQTLVQDDEVGTTAHSRNKKFNEEMSIREVRRKQTQVSNLIFPRRTLRWLNCERKLPRELAVKLIIGYTNDRA